MKKISLVLIAALALLVFELAPVAVITGCTSAGLTSHKTESVTLPSVNAEMERWAAYVKSGKATQSQVDAVKVQYNDYYAAQLTAKAAEATWVNSKAAADQTAFVNATVAASTKGAAVIALVEGYMNSK